MFFVFTVNDILPPPESLSQNQDQDLQTRDKDKLKEDKIKELNKQGILNFKNIFM